MIVYRLAKNKYAHDHTGTGAKLAGGRWNSIDTAILYTSESRALCTVEIAVRSKLNMVPVDYVIVRYNIPDEMKELSLDELPNDWQKSPHPVSTKIIGDRFVKEGKFLTLKVPSAAVPGEFNFLVNPSHKDFSKVKVLDLEPYKFDTRLFEKEL